MLITFLLSQRKSIPAIQKAVEALCQAAGTPIGTAAGRTLHAFPDARRARSAVRRYTGSLRPGLSPALYPRGGQPGGH